ncbi:MAG: signal transduction histidine kinase [Flavobacterium sp.]
MTIEFKNQEPVEIEASLFLTEILIRNLFSNAVNHNLANGSVHILIKKNKIIFSNTGSTIPLKEDKLYQRFSKASTSTHGNGLGLAIVKNIVENQNWIITYSYENKMHQFIVTF